MSTFDEIDLLHPLPWNRDKRVGVGVAFGSVPRYSGGRHKGIDMHAPVGEPVFAAESGVVVFAEDTREIVGNSGNYGLRVDIDHGESLCTIYAHLDVILVVEGEEVEAGQEIGKCGNTGNSDGPHLHFEVHVDGDLVDPMECIKPTPEYFEGAMLRG